MAGIAFQAAYHSKCALTHHRYFDTSPGFLLSRLRSGQVHFMKLGAEDETFSGRIDKNIIVFYITYRRQDTALSDSESFDRI